MLIAIDLGGVDFSLLSTAAAVLLSACTFYHSSSLEGSSLLSLKVWSTLIWLGLLRQGSSLPKPIPSDCATKLFLLL
jgi:hypothetical protein